MSKDRGIEAGIIGPSQADVAAADKVARGPIKKSRVFAGIAAVLGIPSSISMLTACEPQRPAEVRSISTPTSEPARPIATVLPIPELPPTPEPTKVPPTPTVIPPTATEEATSTPKPPEKSPLPNYGVFTGNISNDQTEGVKKGKIVLASIPQAGRPEQIFVFYILDGSAQDTQLLDLKTVQGNSIEGTTRKNLDLKVVFDTTKKTLNGTFTTRTRPSGPDGRPIGQIETQVWTIQAGLSGGGKTDLLEAAKKMKLEQAKGKYGNVDWTNISVADELSHIELP